MSRTDLFRTATFRLSLAVAVAIIAGMVLQFALIFVQLTHFERHRAAEVLTRAAGALKAETPAELEFDVRERSKADLRGVLSGAALFDARRDYIAGDIKEWPQGLVPDGTVHQLLFQSAGADAYEMRFLAVRVPGGRYLVLARSLHLLGELRSLTRRAMLISIVPVVVFALTTGVVLSHRALARIKRMHEAIDRIMEGDLHERLPCRGRSDDLERLAASVNRMLDRLEHLLDEIRDVGNDIAHDLRTPLSRVRARLERAAAQSLDAGHLREVMAQAMQDLDQCFVVITALLRIGEIENGRRRAGFGRVDIVALVADIVDLYEPIAEARGLELVSDCPSGGLAVTGDRDLLIEVLANLVDNALKFTGAGGRVTIAAGYGPPERDGEERDVLLSVADTGIGIPPAERAAVMGRFYRSDKSRHVPGNGLGLSLVGAILRLHEARLSITAMYDRQVMPGTVFEIAFSSLKEGAPELSETPVAASRPVAPPIMDPVTESLEN
ncbi:sensor histidine kinase [Acidomonas methanolica]|uniref:histidine kinase n=1 Tax=Acidomonas methanolica NBRC 104435 TaxID=1231351 RepID=A0A023D754_ACIMT|nr:HAMP domain-containing sensor histidine kinase [Acidomonas methanolica]TCS27327.1 hypothetical protein EDC31_11147 [Acidomonas methanolica]GAJ29978.1 two component sensor histidine kinase [Acidomonas methanolica NBRC 104435]GBQ53489.1 two component sensor histidine kinase [Acidomonas methanolica]GEK99648.1 two-component sensor histidine kinase [Acidomonas methanolica NBRC 104435]